jgi:hypothetical protein
MHNVLERVVEDVESKQTCHYGEYVVGIEMHVNWCVMIATTRHTTRVIPNLIQQSLLANIGITSMYLNHLF